MTFAFPFLYVHLGKLSFAGLSFLMARSVVRLSGPVAFLRALVLGTTLTNGCFPSLYYRLYGLSDRMCSLYFISRCDLPLSCGCLMRTVIAILMLLAFTQVWIPYAENLIALDHPCARVWTFVRVLYDLRLVGILRMFPCSSVGLFVFRVLLMRASGGSSMHLVGHSSLFYERSRRGELSYSLL